MSIQRLLNARFAVALTASTLLSTFSVGADFDLGRDFSATANPNGVWSYGWKGDLAGGYSDLAVTHSSAANGGIIPSWQLTSAQTPAVYCNTNDVAVTFGGSGQANAGTVWFYPGENGRPENYGIIRFTAPSNGNYRLETSVAPVYPGFPQGDTDFHVLVNGSPVLAQFLAPSENVALTGVVALAANEVLDLAVGRGLDGSQYGSGLKISALITPTTDSATLTNLPPPPVVTNPPPVVYADFDLGRDFSSAANPDGVWSYGWKANLGGTYSNLTVRHASPAGYGVTIPSWQLTSFQTPAVYCNTGSVTATFGSTGVAAPGTVWFYPGENGRPENYGVIRFTAPSNSNYRVETTVSPVHAGFPQGDTDFHILTNGTEVMASMLAPSDNLGFTGVVALAENEVVDFAIGRGADGSQYGSGLKITTLVTPTTETPTVTNLPPLPVMTNPPPTIYADFDLGRDFSATANPNGVWSYGWKGDLAGGYSDLAVTHSSAANGGIIASWQLTSAQTPAVYCNTNDVAVTFGGSGQANAGTVWFYPGENGRPENYGIIRFTAPSNGNYRLETSVAPVYPGFPQGDTDFHVLVNGSPVLAQFLAPLENVALTGVVALAANEVLDLAVGRGLDGSQYGSGLKISALITPTTDSATLTNLPPPPVVTNPPPVVYADFDLGRDFSSAANPDGVWSYGWKANLGGTYSNLTVRHASPAGYGVTIPSWQLTSFQTPAVYCNTGSVTATFGSTGVAAPGTVWFYPGENGRPENYGVIRFTAPSNGNYEVQISARPVYDGEPQGNTDFHIVSQGTELFSRFLTPAESVGVTGVVALAANEAIDFAIGRGADLSQYGSGLKIAALITPTTNEVSFTNPPPNTSEGPFDAGRDFSSASNPNGVWSYGWKNELSGAYSNLSVAHLSGVIPSWQLTSGETPAVYCNTSSSTVQIGATGEAAPREIWFFPGEDGRPENFGVIRFIAPSNGTYSITTEVGPVYDGEPQGDSDFHVIHDGFELFAAALAPLESATFSRTVGLSEGSVVDFAIGRGGDTNQFGSGLKIKILIGSTNTATISAPELSGGESGLNLTVIGSTSGVIESSTNLIDWVEIQLPIQTNSATKMLLTDPSGTSGLQRFYRTRPLRR